jgi:hypothetical protein
MKREYVLPDLLASMTADALFAGTAPKSAAKPVGRKQASLFRRWFKPTQVGGHINAPNLSLDDDWVGGWYARTRLLQAATLAQARESRPAGPESAPRIAEAGGHELTVDCVTQMKDFS